MLSSAAFAPQVAWQNFWRNKGLSLFAVSVMTVVLLLVAVSLVLGHSFDQTIQGVESKASTVSVFMRDETPLVNVANLETRLRDDPRVRSVSFVSKSQALQRYEHDPNIPSDMIQGLEGYNPLPATVDVDIRDIRDESAIVGQVKDLPLLDKNGATNYREDVISRIVLFGRFVAILGGALLLGLTGVAVFIVMMSIRTAVFVRRQEIEVMKLVGATDWFVRGPFLLEGMLAGLVAALIAVMAVGGGYRPLVTWGQSYLPWLPLSYDAAFLGQLVLMMGAFGLILGAVGSYLGVRRFLQT
jgi:cell division transport system permease protein